MTKEIDCIIEGLHGKTDSKKRKWDAPGSSFPYKVLKEFECFFT